MHCAIKISIIHVLLYEYDFSNNKRPTVWPSPEQYIVPVSISTFSFYYAGCNRMIWQKEKKEIMLLKGIKTIVKIIWLINILRLKLVYSKKKNSKI